MNRKFRRMGGVKREVDALRSVWACPYYGQLSLIFGTSLRDVVGLRLCHMLGIGGFRSKKVNFLGTPAGEGWSI